MNPGLTMRDESAMSRFFAGRQPGEVPLYSYAAAARYLKLPYSTVHWWVKGRARSQYEPVISKSPSQLLSFNDLMELYVIKQLRSVHGVSLKGIRKAVEYAEKRNLARVLLSDELATYSGSVLLSGIGESVAISKGGQVALHELINQSLKRIERSDSGVPLRLHPGFDGESLVNDRYPVSVSPLVAFGRPTLAESGIKTAVVAARIDAGEDIEEVADDYAVLPALITSAVVYENAAR